MVKKLKDPIIGEVVETRAHLSLSELCQTCCVHADRIVELVEEGILEPTGKQVPEWRFSGIAIVRVRTVRRLQEDLGVNLAGVALAIELMEELQATRARLRKSEPSIETNIIEPE